jgi:hypothetical protein
MDPEKSDGSDPSQWIKAALAPADMLRWAIVSPYLNQSASEALGKQIFNWYLLSNDEAIDGLQDAYMEALPDRFFLAEDTSRFVEREKLTRYRADFHNFGDRRAVERLAEYTYGPLRRIRFG